MVEGGSIVYTASVNNPVTGSPLTVTLSNGVVITIPVGASSANSEPVPVRGDDAYKQDDEALSVTIGSTSEYTVSLTSTSRNSPRSMPRRSRSPIRRWPGSTTSWT